ncbi:MAG TPA: hypothetical protein VEH86_06185 [Candidatus Acidoferrum sp.]|nr:hypothetical protein [Candidatus Acidoferrum sp.]
MSFLRRSGKKQEKIIVHASQALSELEQLCGDDKQTYVALHHTMFLDPRKIGASMKDAAENAKKFAKEKNLYRARVWYDIAGGLAIYEGDVKKVVEFFGESQKISGLKYPILDDADKAVAKAQEYYKKYLKS